MHVYKSTSYNHYNLKIKYAEKLNNLAQTSRMEYMIIKNNN